MKRFTIIIRTLEVLFVIGCFYIVSKPRFYTRALTLNNIF